MPSMLTEYSPKEKITGVKIVGGKIGKGSIWIDGITGVIIGFIGIGIAFVVIILWKANNFYPLSFKSVKNLSK